MSETDLVMHISMVILFGIFTIRLTLSSMRAAEEYDRFSERATSRPSHPSRARTTTASRPHPLWDKWLDS